MIEKLIQNIGLSEEEAKIYVCLVQLGTIPARKIALETKINRSLVYKVLKQLIDQGIVIEDKNKKAISVFRALHPSKLQTFVKQKESDLKLADQSFYEVVSTLGAQFNLTCGKPTVHFYEGVEGLKYVYKDILFTKKDIKLIRSPKDNDIPELGKLVTEQIKKQVERGIKTEAIVPMELSYDDFIMKRDVENLVTRCRIPREELHIPAQIIIYGHKVAMTSFEGCMITTIIEDIGIAETHTQIFDRLWKTGLVR
jgi:sugar-specific transcriptional regulator TrmB